MGREMEVPGLLGSLGTQAFFLGPNMWVSTKEKIAHYFNQNSPLTQLNSPTIDEVSSFT